MNELIEIKVLDDFNIWLKFNDGKEKIVNFRPFIGEGFTSELLVYDNFKKVSIDSAGGLVWENGFDFCPNYLKELKEENKHLA
jgi:hypothetical protein